MQPVPNQGTAAIGRIISGYLFRSTPRVDSLVVRNVNHCPARSRDEPRDSFRPARGRHRSGRREAGAPFPRPRTQRAFTLLELLVVLTLAALLMVVVPPLLSQGVSSAELKSAARKLAAALKYARNQAITHHQEAVLVLNLKKHYFRVTGKDRRYSLPENIEISLVTARSEVAAQHIGKIRFFPDGTSTGGRITLAQGKQKFLIDINWLTGRVAILG